jgi:hypothetical protein
LADNEEPSICWKFSAISVFSRCVWKVGRPARISNGRRDVVMHAIWARPVGHMCDPRFVDCEPDWNNFASHALVRGGE